MNILKEILEYFYFLSGPAVVFVAYKALEQIKVTREIAKTNSKREAFKVTAQECRYYSEVIVPLINTLDEQIVKLDIQLFTKSNVKIEHNSLRVKPFTAYDHYDDSFDEISENLANVLNSLGDFSMFFISGVADEKLAYHSVATTYCSTVRKLAPIIVPASKDEEEDSVLTLFMIWNNRKEKASAIKEKKKLDEKIKKNSDVTIKPIGT